MARPSAHRALDVLINGRLAGRLEKEPSGAIFFRYDRAWLDWTFTFPISRALPLQTSAHRGAPVAAVFDNLLPDGDDVRRIVAERTGARGADPFSLLEQIGRDCVGAMQFVPEGAKAAATESQGAGVQGVSLSDEEIERMLANLQRAPLGIEDDDFRISVAGAQEKTALLYHEGRWRRPTGTTPTTHILKPQLGRLAFSWGEVDLSDSVDNEHYCLKLLEGFGLPVARTEIATFGERRVLVVERFDRLLRPDGEIIRLPQEDCCQALGIPSAQKYQKDGGPDAVQILKLLRESDEPVRDRENFFKSQILFWLMGATDGHAKNFSLFLRPGGRFRLTPFYDVLSVQPQFAADRIPHARFTLAMSAGRRRNYRLVKVEGRHFLQTAQEAGLGLPVATRIIREILETTDQALEHALTRMPGDFDRSLHEAVAAGVRARNLSLSAALTDPKAAAAADGAEQPD